MPSFAFLEGIRLELRQCGGGKGELVVGEVRLGMGEAKE